MTQPVPSSNEPQKNADEGQAVAETGTASAPVSDQPDSPPAKSRSGANRPTDWFDKIFRRGFTPEDLVLYLLSMLLIFAFWSIFRDLQAREETLIASISKDVAEAWGPAAEKKTQELGVALDDDEWINMQHLSAQLTLSAMRYQQGSISTAAISTRQNLAFLVGAIMAIIGCVIIIRGVRQSQTKFDAKLSDKTQVTLLTASPGIFVVLMGAIIIVAAVVRSGERPEIKDNDIQCLRCGVVVLGPNEDLQPTNTASTAEEKPVDASVDASGESGSAGFPAIRTTPISPQEIVTQTLNQ